MGSDFSGTKPEAMKASEKAAMLIQQAQKKAKADFERWKDGYLSDKLAHKTAQEARAFLRQKYTAIMDSHLANNSHLFDVRNTPREELARAWAGCFLDWEEGLIPLPGRTPEYSAEALDLASQERGPYIPAAWLLPLAVRFKEAYILEFINDALNDKLEVWQRKRYNQIAFGAKLAIRFVLKQGALPEGAILEALENAKKEEGKAGALPEEALQELAQELLAECRGVVSEDELTYLQKRIDSVFQRKPQLLEARTKIYALYYWYLREAGLMPKLHVGSGKKAAGKALAEKHGVSAQNFFQVFNAVGRNSDKNPKKLPILEKVIPMLSDYPEALKLANADLDKLQKNNRE